MAIGSVLFKSSLITVLAHGNSSHAVKKLKIDTNNKQSQINTYKAPKYITPTIGVVGSFWNKYYNSFTTEIFTNKNYKEIYYTTDKSNPKTSNTRQKIYRTNRFITFKK